MSGKLFAMELRMKPFLLKENKVILSMKPKKNKKDKGPVVKIDRSLDKYVDMPLFQEKVDEANRILNAVGLPKEKKKDK